MTKTKIKIISFITRNSSNNTIYLSNRLFIRILKIQYAVFKEALDELIRDNIVYTKKFLSGTIYSLNKIDTKSAPSIILNNKYDLEMDSGVEILYL